MSLPGRKSAFLHLILLCLLLVWARAGWAQPVQINSQSEGYAGLLSQVLEEQGTPLDLPQAMALFHQGRGQPGKSPILNFGIDSPPVWLQLALDNPADQPVAVMVVSGTTWIDHLQLSLVQADKLLGQWQMGDTLPGAKQLIPGIGFATRLLIPPGRSELYLRAASPDPLVLPIEVLDVDVFDARQHEYRFVYGLIYGFLLSMIVYNSMLYIGLRDRSYLHYSLYLALFGLLNMTYTGHGFAWFWPDNPSFQNHCILLMMVMFGCSGLAFTSSFLSLERYAPKSLRLLQALCILALASQAFSLLFNAQAAETLAAFVFALVASLGMLLLGILALKHRHVAGHYYLAAMFFGMLGTLITTLTVWGLLPFTGWNYGAIKIGIILQAILLALGLSFKVRQQQKSRLQAERMAERDPLTGLHNRRGFNEQAAAIWSTAVRNQRPLSLIMLDLDHFKTINDLHGHATGDKALKLTADMLAQNCRGGDVLGRWGGEEFLLLLPETGISEAQALAERLRMEIQTLGLAESHTKLALSASFGVIERSSQGQLEQLINQADRLLYVAKHSGRNRVCRED
jgi:diguanylate cyclase (GGDEF)-like protein